MVTLDVLFPISAAGYDVLPHSQAQSTLISQIFEIDNVTIAPIIYTTKLISKIVQN